MKNLLTTVESIWSRNYDLSLAGEQPLFTPGFCHAQLGKYDSESSLFVTLEPQDCDSGGGTLST